MKLKSRNLLVRATIGLLVFFAACQERKIDFSTEVKPILNTRCISCHGGVKQNGGFSVLFREEALAVTESGKPAIIPGDPHGSEMIRRLLEDDPELRMPYKEPPLPDDEIRILRRWIEEGAVWGDHWAYSPPRPVQVPQVRQVRSGLSGDEETWVRNTIDHFILARLQERGLSPSPPADKPTLVRRVFLDLIGIPPTEQQAQAFINDDRPDAYDRLVEQLLSSPHFGEKWAAWWLDLARYADTKGYEADPSRVIWRYRDYVIRSFNEDKPFDQFTIEQLAGDMLPDPTDEQIIATAFHRNTMNNTEGGTDDEEFRIAAVIDRISTSRDLKRKTIDAINAVNHEHYKEVNDPETLTRMAQYEMAYRMQISVPEVMNINDEPAYIHEMYGTTPGKASFANNCLLARKLVEQGVRFVQLFDWGWDSHGIVESDALEYGFRNKCREVDRPMTALLLDLKQRGLLDETLVVWGGEFGRTPMQENREGKMNPYLGRDHHVEAFTMWMAGGGIKKGMTWGETDEIGYYPVNGRVSLHDVQATILHQLGMDHEKLTYQFQGRPFRLTDVGGKVISEIVA
jgi:hypothetical protein